MCYYTVFNALFVCSLLIMFVFAVGIIGNLPPNPKGPRLHFRLLYRFLIQYYYGTRRFPNTVI